MKPKPAPVNHDQVMELLKRGLTQGQVALKLKISASQIDYVIKKAKERK